MAWLFISLTWNTYICLKVNSRKRFTKFTKKHCTSPSRSNLEHKLQDKHQVQINFTFTQETLDRTRSSWLNCALRDDEAVYWVSVGHYEAVAVGN